MVAANEKYEEALQRKVLTWNYYDVVEQLNAGKGPNETLTKVPTKFKDIQEYLDVFGKLVVEECAAQLASGSREDVDRVLDRHAVINSVEKSDPYVRACFTMQQDASTYFAKHDVVLVARKRSDKTNQPIHALGIVESKEGDSVLWVRFNLNPDEDTDAKNQLRLVSTDPQMTVNSQWYISALANLATVQREWAALQQLPKIPFAKSIVTTKPMRVLHTSYEISPQLRQVMEKEYNVSQLEAITAGLQGDAIVLIQGPPGTGKTRTILGLLSIISQSVPEGTFSMEDDSTSKYSMQSQKDLRLNLLWQSAPWLASKPDPRDDCSGFNILQPQDGGTTVFGLKMPPQIRTIESRKNPKPHVLVCAPSNSALDEIVMRLVAHGLYDEQGTAYSPDIVRCGVAKNIHHSVAAFSLENRAADRMEQMAGSTTGRRTGVIVERIRQSILNEADIVCSTLSFAGSGVLQRMNRPFDVVVVDEAAQAVEPSLLVPLLFGAKQVYLVGDPVQLPATVISTRAVEYNYNQSLFKRLQQSGYPVQVLDTQYRMHPDISAFPSLSFYKNMLRNAPNMAKNTKRDWHQHVVFGPFALLDVQGHESTPESGNSRQNLAEAEICLLLCKHLWRLYKLGDKDAIGIISPYKAQVKLLKDKLTAALGQEGAKHIDVNTIDGFQGREKEIIIFSAVRSSQRGVGFVSDERRLNVAITRARTSLIMLANCKSLQQDEMWSKLIEHARGTGRLYRASRPYTSFLTAVLSGTLKPEVPSFDDQMDEDSDCYSEDDAPPQPAQPPQKAARRTPGGRGRGKR